MSSTPQGPEDWLQLFEEYATGRRSPGYDGADQAIAGALGAVGILNEGKDPDSRSLIHNPDLKSSKPQMQRLLIYLIRGCDGIRQSHGYDYELHLNDGHVSLSFHRR